MSHYDDLGTVEPVIELVRRRVVAQADVRCVHRLVPLMGGRFAYLIETPFLTFPRYAVGCCDELLADVRIEQTCGLLSSAEAEFALRYGSEVDRAAAREALGEI